VPPLNCTQLKTKYNTYVSFCATVNETHYNQLLNPNKWEDDFLIMPFEGKGRYLNSKTAKPETRTRNHAPSPSPSPTQANKSQIPIPNQDKQINDLRRQNRLLEDQLKELRTAWDADSESVLSSVPSEHNSKPPSSVCSENTSALNTEHDLNLHLALEEGLPQPDHSTAHHST